MRAEEVAAGRMGLQLSDELVKGWMRSEDRENDEKPHNTI